MQGANTHAPIVVWQPIPNSSQELALDSRAQHTFYTGARGPGKTDTQLMRFRKNVGRGYGPFWRGIILDREYKNLDDLVNKSKRWFNQFEDGARFLASGKDYKWIWPTGEELLFRAGKNMDDYWDHHGQEYPFIGFNELTKYPTGELYEAMKSVNRSSYKPEKDGWIGGYLEKNAKYPVGPEGAIPDPIPLEFFSTGNPWGAGHSWVKREFIDPAPYGVMTVKETDVFDPAIQKRRKVSTTKVAIFGTYRENIYLDPIYIAQLEAIKDKNKRRAWLAGSWDIVAGGAIDDVWDQSIHVIEPFEIPENWKVDRAFDWGSTQPFSLAWFAESNGEEVTLANGKKVTFPSGTIIMISEWYGAEEIGLNQGLRLSARDIARGIKTREAKLRGYSPSGDKLFRSLVHGDIWQGPADNQIRNQNEAEEETIETKFESEGVYWNESNKSKGSREIGLQLFRDRLQAAKDGEGAGFYLFNTCRAAITILPTLPRDEKKPDDIDTEAEDHIWDMLRYRLLAGVRTLARKIETAFPI